MAAAVDTLTSTSQIMRTVLLAMCPGLAATLWFFGFAALSNIVWALLFSVAFEALALRCRKQPLRPQLLDGSVLITGLLLALALPPGAPIGLIALGVAISVLIAKHAFGGFGRNLFNPAMAGYAVLLILFPAAFSQWASPGQFDGMTGATTLDVFKHNNSLLVAALWQNHPEQFGTVGGYGWEWINAAFLAGGAWLLYRKIFSWRIPLSLLAALGVCALFVYDNGSSASSGSPLFHWFSGATMIGAFFVATEPVTAPRDNISQLLYGASIGVLIFAIRYAGTYADGITFAVLITNLFSPVLDRISPLISSKFMKSEQQND